MKADVAASPIQPIEVAGCNTIPELFHRRVAEWGARTAFREKRLGKGIGLVGKHGEAPC